MFVFKLKTAKKTILAFSYVSLKNVAHLSVVGHAGRHISLFCYKAKTISE